MARERIQVDGAFALVLAACAPSRMVRFLPAVLCLLAAHPAFAQQQSAARRWYVDVGAGVNWLDQESGHPQPADTGYRLSVAGGYQMSPRWALELETGFVSNGLQATQDRPESTLDQVPLLLNLVLTFPNQTALRPYLGAGVGVLFESSKGDSSDAGGDAGLQFLVGARYVLDERKSIGLDYRFIMMGATSGLAEEVVGNDSLLLHLRLAL
jgi:opacity protein-like surface antigen